MSKRISRIAPSPTGALHLGNARTFLINWALARQDGWKLLMRIEDLEGPRVKLGAIEQTLDTLAWLGIDHDGDVLIQSRDLTPCRTALQQLADQHLTYACQLSRKEIQQAAAAPHVDDHELRFPPELRPPREQWGQLPDDDTNARFVTAPGSVEFDDLFAGPRKYDPHAEVGDYVIWTRRGMPAYQLAVVVDDARTGITDVVRGDDLLSSAARQMLLQDALGLPRVRYCHLPLVYGDDGRRLAKRHGDTRLTTYRASGIPPERIIGLLASWCGILERPAELSAADFRDRFSLDRLSPDPVVFTEEDRVWLH